jgi:hypothetical protein
MDRMGRSGLQISVAAMLGLVACVALNLWLFRLGFLAGFIGLNVTKHVAVAALCQVVGVNGRPGRSAARSGMPGPHAVREAL